MFTEAISVVSLLRMMPVYAQLRDDETGEVVAEVKVIAADTTGDFTVYYGSPRGQPRSVVSVPMHALWRSGRG